MNKAFAITILAAGAANAGAQVLTIPSEQPRLAFDDTAALLFIPDSLADPLPDLVPEDKPTLDWTVPSPRKPAQQKPVETDGELRVFPDSKVTESSADQTDPQTVVRDDTQTDIRDAQTTSTRTTPAGAEVPSDFTWAVSVPERDWKYIVIHHSATKGGSIESIHREHRRRKDAGGRQWLGIGYHFVVGNGSGMENGETRPTFRWDEQLHGAHSGSIRHNGSGIGICVIGNFEKELPSATQRAAVIELVSQLAREYDIPADRIIGHRQIRATACPGRYFPLKQIVNDSVGLDSPQTSRN